MFSQKTKKSSYILCFLTGEVDCPKKVLNYICGFHQHGDIDDAKEEALRKHMEKVASLKQNKYAKIGLNIGLVIILCIGIFLYIFWSFWTYVPV